MIITHLQGGLGNQMFQYAAGLALAERHRTVLKLDVSWFRHYPHYEAHNRYALSCFNITEQFATAAEVDAVRGFGITRTERWARGAAKLLRLRRAARALGGDGRSFGCPTEGLFTPAFTSLPDDTYLHGMWQTEKFFAGAESLLRLHFSFRYPAQPAVLAMAERIRSGPSVAIHFRRGDYARNAQFTQQIGVLGLAYYETALSALAGEVAGLTAYVFSDDIDAIEREFRPAVPHVFVRATQPWHAYDKIRLMSLCDHAIISNSTFAWWGAWLNANPNKRVFAPDPWLAGKPAESAETVPASWTRLSRA